MITIEERKKIAMEKIVPAGQKSTLALLRSDKHMPMMKEYSEKTKVHSPISRGI